MNEEEKTNSRPATPEYKQRCYEIAKKLISGFIWETTPEGHKYWEEVYDKLLKMSRE